MIDILVSRDPKFGTSYLYCIESSERDTLEKIVTKNGCFMRLYRGFSFNNISEYNEVFKQFNLKE